MLFIAMFMLLSAGISYLSGMDSAFYPLLLSSLLTALLGAFPLIFVEKREQITNKEGFCIVVGSSRWSTLGSKASRGSRPPDRRS